MEILLILILIGILWGNSKSQSIVNSIENINFELRHGETNKLLREIRYALPDTSPDYSYDFEQLRNELKNINDELQWNKSLSFAGQTINNQQEVIAELMRVNETLKEIIEAQQETVVKLDELLDVSSETN